MLGEEQRVCVCRGVCVCGVTLLRDKINSFDHRDSKKQACLNHCASILALLASIHQFLRRETQYTIIPNTHIHPDTPTDGEGF
jgi:hypothetical protein